MTSIAKAMALSEKHNMQCLSAAYDICMAFNVSTSMA